MKRSTTWWVVGLLMLFVGILLWRVHGGAPVPATPSGIALVLATSLGYAAGIALIPLIFAIATRFRYPWITLGAYGLCVLGVLIALHDNQHPNASGETTTAAETVGAQGPGVAVADAPNLGPADASDLAQKITNSAFVHPSRPNDPDDIRAWQNYVTLIVQANMGNITNSPYVYLVPSASDPANTAALARVRDQLTGVVAATVLPGNMIAAAGPSSATTAQVLETAFQNATPGSFQGVVVLFIGDSADEPAVRTSVTPSGATFKFAQM